VTLLLTDRLQQSEMARQARQKAIVDQVEWARAYRTLEKQGRGRAYDYEYLWPWVPMLRAKHRRKFIFKSRKVSFTEQGINWLLWRLDAFPGTNAAYIRETQKRANHMMRTRIGEAIKDPRNPMKDRLVYDEIENKVFRPGSPLSTRNQILSAYGTKIGQLNQQAGDKVRGDTLESIFYDERQLQQWNMEGVVASSVPLDALLHTLTGGTPTVSGNILGVLWERSSQHKLLFECWNCSTPRSRWWQELTIDSIHNMDKPDTAFVGCQRCHVSLEWMRGKYGTIYHPENGRVGRVEWVPQRLYGHGDPREGQAFTQQYLGFRIDRLCIALSPPDEPYFSRPEMATRYLLEDWNDPVRSRREKLNEIFGLEYEGPDAPFSLGRMMRCVIPELSLDSARRERYLARILTYDWGVETTWNVWGLAPDLRMVLMGFGKIEGDQRFHGEELVKVGKQYAVAWAVGDKGHSLNREHALVEVWRRKAVSIFYATHEKRSLRPKKRMVWFQGENVVVADRNFLIENLQEEVAKGKNGVIIPGRDVEAVRLMLTEYAHVTFGADQDPRELGFEMEIKQEQTKWVKSGADHHLHCAVYARAAILMHRRSNAIGYRGRRGARGLTLMEDEE